MVMVAVRARHPARTLGDGEKEDEEDDDEPDEEVFGAFLTTWRRNSRATWGGILLAIFSSSIFYAGLISWTQ